MQKAKEIRKLAIERIEKAITDAKKERYKLKVVHKIEPIKNTSQINKKRREIARLKTILRERRTHGEKQEKN